MAVSNQAFSRTKNTKLNIMFGFCNKVITLFFPFIVRTIFIYTFGSEYLGLDSLFVSILQVLNLSELGISEAIVYALYKPLAKKDIKLVCALLALYRKFYRIIGLVILAAGLCVTPFLDKLVKGGAPNGLNLQLLYIIFLSNTSVSYFLFSYKTSLFVANQERRFVDNISTIISFVKSAFQVVVLLAFHNYYVYIVLLPLFTVANNIAVGFASYVHFPDYVPRGKIPSDVLLQIKKNLGGLVIQKVCVTTRNSLDSIIISAFIGLKYTALYNNYFLILTTVHGFTGILTSSMQGSIGNSVATESVEKNHFDMQKFMFLYSWISGICVALMACLYQPFMELWLGKEYVLSDLMMALFCMYFFLMCMGDVRSSYVDASGIYWQSRYRALLESIVNLILNIVLGKLFGLYGIILATLISMFLINFIYGSSLIYKYYFKNKKLHEYYLNDFYYLAVTAAACIVLFHVCSYIKLRNLFAGLFVKVLVVFVSVNIYFFLVYRKSKYFIASKDLIGAFIKKFNFLKK